LTQESLKKFSEKFLTPQATPLAARRAWLKINPRIKNEV